MQLPYALRDPFRDSHFTDPGYLALWPDAKDYLATLEAGVEDRACSTCRCSRPTNTRRRCARPSASCGPATTRRRSSTRSASEWDAITEQIGVDKQKAVYANWAAKSGAYPK